MRRYIFASALLAASCLAADAGPVGISGARGELILVRVADCDTHYAGRMDRRADWRYRAFYTRLLHNEYMRAGYPVRHPSRRTYSRW
jgi:hypothetical protein